MTTTIADTGTDVYITVTGEGGTLLSDLRELATESLIEHLGRPVRAVLIDTSPTTRHNHYAATYRAERI